MPERCFVNLIYLGLVALFLLNLGQISVRGFSFSSPSRPIPMAAAQPRYAGASPAVGSVYHSKSIGENLPWIQPITYVKMLTSFKTIGVLGQWRHEIKKGVSRRDSELHVLGTSTVQSPAEAFPAFLPPEVYFLKEKKARDMACKMQRLPVQTSLSQQPILTSCVTPSTEGTNKSPVLLLHGFDSSLLEWRCLYPLLELGGVESWAMDVLGWGFSNTEGVASFGVAAKREHLYEFWKTYVKRPMVLVGASLGGSIAIDFAVAHPEAVAKLVLIDAQGFAEGVGNMSAMPKFLAYAGMALLKSVPLRSYANYLAFSNISNTALIDGMQVGRLHTLVTGWADASVSFMLSGGYNVASCIPQVQQETLVIWGEQDKILPKEYAVRFQKELPRAQLVYVQDAGHIPHVERPSVVADLILEFVGLSS